MPSAAHQTLLLWAARKMAYDGFVIAGYDGVSARGGPWNTLAAPPTLAGVRPDAWGYDGRRIALAEAKTAGDIDTAHTRAQLRAFRALRTTATRQVCQMYLAIPRSAAPALDRVLAELGLIGVREIVRMHVPDVLLEEVA